MCNACGFLCCGHDDFRQCGCNDCPERACWDEDEFDDGDDDDYGQAAPVTLPHRHFVCVALKSGSA